MKKLLIVLSILVLIVVVLIGIPKTTIVEKSISIKASKEVVFENVSKFENFLKWSPWSKLDTIQIVSITGTDGTVGAIYKWDSESDEVGHGFQKITSVSEDKIEIELTFTAPWESTSKVYYLFENGDEIKVTWGYEGEGSILEGLFISGMLGETFESGLKDLKNLCENN